MILFAEAPAATGSHWILSSKGRRLFPLNLRPEDVDVEDIAHALSHTCRFGGHCREFYSVAEHSVRVAYALALPANLAFIGLMHDAAEAYVGDMVRPLKRALPEFAAAEQRVWEAIAQRFGLPPELPNEVKIADTRMLQTERRDLLRPHPWPWGEDQIADGSAAPYPSRISPWSPADARRLFLHQFRLLARETGRDHEGLPE